MRQRLEVKFVAKRSVNCECPVAQPDQHAGHHDESRCAAARVEQAALVVIAR
jgi:hypothetical protein